MSKSSFFKIVSKNEESPKIIPDSQTCARQPGEQLARLWWSKVIIEKVLPTFIPIFQALLCPTPLILTVIRYKFCDKCKESSKKKCFFLGIFPKKGGTGFSIPKLYIKFWWPLWVSVFLNFI